MPYATGTANNATELRTAMTNLATANGWTWDATNEMLYKAPVYGKLTVSGLDLYVKSALGYSGATLTTPAASGAGVSSLLVKTGITALNYPLTYHVFVHANPDVIVLAVNWGSVWWQWLMFGNSKPLGDEANPLWHWGSAANPSVAQGVYIRAAGDATDTSVIGQAAAPFWPGRRQTGTAQNSAIYNNVDGIDWRYNVDATASTEPNKANAGGSVAPLLQTQPNAWNLDAQLLRIPVLVPRASGFWSYVAELEHVRMTRNDNISDGYIQTVGSDRWFIAPCFRKSSANRDSSSGTAGGEIAVTHSGTMALAIRYDGP